jgi:transcription initiation factor TFIID subunit 15
MGPVMGDIPSNANMISSIITNPGPGDTIAANQDFNVNVQVANLVAGSFTNPDTTYYAAPQALQGGKVVGHTHVTIQSLGNNIATTTPPDAGTFAFFKGINDAGDGNGGLSATVAGGLPPGVYRVCTMTSASNHQPVTMPVSPIRSILIINSSC